MAERDIVQRLRQYANEEDWPISHMLAVLREAADEIERLRASTPKGSEPCGRAVPDYHGETGECVRPAGHDGECYDGPVSPPPMTWRR